MTRVAMIGCGAAHARHCECLRRREDVTLVGHCDIEEDRAEAAASQFGGDAYAGHERLLDETKPDAVYLAAPPLAREELVEAAAERGVHMFIETPMELNRMAAKRANAALRKSKVIVSAGYVWRYFDTVATARKKLNGKAVSLVTGYWHGPMPEAGWRRRMDKSGGQVVERTTHVIDLIRYLCGEAAEVYAAGSKGCAKKADDHDLHDSSAITMRLKSGATASVTSSYVAKHGAKAGIEIVTPEAVFTFNSGQLTVQEDGRSTRYAPKNDIYADQTEAFIDAVRGGKKNRVRSSYSDALKTFLVTHAANESMRTGLPVKP